MIAEFITTLTCAAGRSGADDFQGGEHRSWPAVRCSQNGNWTAPFLPLSSRFPPFDSRLLPVAGGWQHLGHHADAGADLQLGSITNHTALQRCSPVFNVAHRCIQCLQVVDDILDITATTEQLGKTAGKDLASSKTTYPSILGLDQVRAADTVYWNRTLLTGETMGSTTPPAPQSLVCKTEMTQLTFAIRPACRQHDAHVERASPSAVAASGSGADRGRKGGAGELRPRKGGAAGGPRRVHPGPPELRGSSGTRCRHERSQHGSWRAEPALAAKPGGCLSSEAKPQLKFARQRGRCQGQCRRMSGGAAAPRMVQAGAIFAWQPTVNWQSAARMPWMQQQNCRNLPGSALRSDTARDLQGGVASLVRM